MPHATKEKWDEWYRKNKPRRNQTWNAWYQRNKEKLAAKKAQYRLANIEKFKAIDHRARRKRRQMLAQYKLEKGCAICGYRGHPEALEFDHLPGTDKRERISVMYRDKWADVLAEIAKCQVLCANCHAIETASRRRAARQAKREAKRQAQAETQLRLFGT